MNKLPNERNFPSNKLEALAFLYIKRQDLSGKSPEELVDMYTDAYDRVRARFRAIQKERRDAD